MESYSLAASSMIKWNQATSQSTTP
uniref:Uncharacterized protein n=1 Tax=Arundo donax TaxID=35708 RepID=A0A0A9FZW8_ARUDO